MMVMTRTRILLLIVLAGLGLGGWAAYEMGTADESAAIGAGAGPLTPERLAELASGEMAGFQVSTDRPEVAREVTLEGPDGKVTLEAFHGRVLLVNLWAEWCAPCIEEMPTLDRLETALGGEAFRVLPISLDRAGIEASQATLEEFGGTHLRTLNDPDMALMAALGVTGLPSTILIDRQGRELGRLIGPAEWDSPEARKLIAAAIAGTD